AGLLKPTDITWGQTDVLNGIAYDAKHDRLYVTGKNWPKVFEIRILPPPTPARGSHLHTSPTHVVQTQH
ncbi:MAG: glutaminyl-peptide cyclotransferase, partial [Pseudomonadota bacterium]|nr:glutaminyl-peptide cyclotransferase [Pseudomonadota bacterium]